MKSSLLSNLEETREFARNFASTLAPGSTVAFFGDLGAGKTTFIKALVAAKSTITEAEVSSPTFVYLHVYPENLFHFDLYRLTNSAEFRAMGFQEYFETDGICLIEWSERIQELLPDSTIRVHLEHAGEGARRITIE